MTTTLAASSSSSADPMAAAAAAAMAAMRLPRGHDSADAAAATQTIAPPATATQASNEDCAEAYGPFEGPEKLLELWFAPLASHLPSTAQERRFALVPGQEARLRRGLRSVARQEWEDMLDLVSCKVLSVLEGEECDAFLLSESSMFVFAHKIILKTCGTTTLLFGLERILRLAHRSLGIALPAGVAVDEQPVSCEAISSEAESAARSLGALVRSAFYSRKSFMFPDRQKGPHRDWMLEVGVLDRYLDRGAAYTVGKMNGDHWLLYMASSDVPVTTVAQQQQQQQAVSVLPKLGDIGSVQRPLSLANLGALAGGSSDQTLEVLMTHLSSRSCARFSYPMSMSAPAGVKGDRGHALGQVTSDELGLSTLFPESSLDAFAFEPCGYSANALVNASHANGAGYWTVHVTPEEDSSYASFETNVEVRDASNVGGGGTGEGSASSAEECKAGAVANTIESFDGLVGRVVSIFEPGRLSVTLFTSTSRSKDSSDDNDEDEQSNGDNVDDGEGTDGTSTLNASVLSAGSVLHALELPGYRRTDRIAYEFEDYDLVFVSFDKRGTHLPRR